ncbi:MAG TPA: N-glycosylase/DNA lyase [Spirochaetota bacterium]|nr:N-glycosylase/DNA lyase [Spirochaetota bacterium]
MNDTILQEIREIHESIKNRIEERLSEFKGVWEGGSEEKLFCELVFCLLTPGARARNAWSCLETIRTNGLLMHGDTARISHCLNLVRFKNNKARNVVEARRLFRGIGKVSMRAALNGAGDDYGKREWLVSSVRGMGYKEASHFLRNVGFYNELAILDRHVLKNLSRVELIPSVPQSLTKKRYLETEKNFRELAVRLRIPMSHLDFVFWYRETGDIFK